MIDVMKDYKQKLKDALDDKLVPVEVQEWIEENFPELVESEDERIKKQIIYAIKELHVCDETKRKCIAWLEKQSEKIEPIDKVEPKFKVGDWVVRNGETLQISGIDTMLDGTFHYWFTKGTWLSSKKMGNTMLWTIQDAKEGDVLAVEPIGGYSYSFVAIYKKQNEKDFDSYCFVGFDGKFYDGENGHSVENIHPATKEQRDALFAKMKEAGYEWEIGKKELKKIKHNPVWSEEDNEMFLHCCAAIRIADYSSIEDRNKMESWFKTLKDRIQTQPKQEWSEEDEATFTVIGSLILDNFSAEDASKTLTWLHSLRPNHWKPSDEQMKVLKEACDEHWEPDGLDPLYTLYQDLKELREE